MKFDIERIVACVIVLLVLLLTPLRALSSEKTEACAQWAYFAQYGAASKLQGKAPQIIVIKREDFLEKFKIYEEAAKGKMALFDDDLNQKTIEAVTYGYRWIEAQPDDKVPASAEEAFGLFFDVCMARTDV